MSDSNFPTDSTQPRQEDSSQPVQPQANQAPPFPDPPAPGQPPYHGQVPPQGRPFPGQQPYPGQVPPQGRPAPGQPPYHGQVPPQGQPFPGQQPYSGQVPPQGRPVPGASRTSPKAIAGMVLGIAFFVIGWIPVVQYFCMASAVVGLILSILALKEIKVRPDLTGRGMAITGLVLSIVYIGLSVLLLLACASMCAGLGAMADFSDLTGFIGR